MSGQSPYMSAAQYGYPTSFQQRDNRYPGNSTVETAMALNRRPSLLASYHNHFSSPERASLAPYIFSVAAPVSMGPHVDEHSKRTRYPPSIPLSIDVKKEQPLYQPQTEAISPILDEPKIDSHMRDTTIIRNSISKLESDIEVTMKKLHRAKLSQSEIKSQADRSAADEEENDNHDVLFQTNDSQTLIEKILHDNRKKVEDGQKVLNQLNNNMDLTIPLYQEPSDLESIEKIRTQYMNVMKNRLINLFKKSRERYMCRTKFESEKYDQSYEQWQKSIDKDEKANLAKDISIYRDAFEKSFPELRKVREDKEKKHSIQNTTESSLPSTDQPQQILSNTNSIEQENDIEEEDEKMRKSSVIPPIMYDSWQRKHQYFNQNDYIKGDVAAFYKKYSKMSSWSPEEKQIFIDKFTQSPKHFGYISSFLEHKTTEQCVQFYYMTKKTENYKNLLRKQSQASKRKAKQNTTTMTTTTVTSSTTIETTLVTKVTSSNTIVSSTSQQILAIGQDPERSIDRIDNDEDRRDINSGDTNDGKGSNKNRCQLLSCTTEKVKKKNRKNRLRAFPTKWTELSKEHQEEIRRSLQIPSDVQRCCTRCYEKLILQVRQRQTNPTTGEEDDDNDETNMNQNSKDEEEWNETEIHAFTEALEKFNHDWTQIAEYVHRSEESCRAFYYKKQRKNISPSDDHNIDEDNGSISGSELGQIKQTNDDNVLKTINDDSNDSTHGMVIDENEEQPSIIEEKSSKPILPKTNLTTITSLVEKEISKTLNETEKRSANNNINTSPERSRNNNNNNNNNPIPPPPPPLVTLKKSHSPATHYQYSSHPQQQQQYLNKGSIMRGTPISSSTPTNKPIGIDISPAHSHHYNNNNNPRNDYAHLKSPKILDRNIEQQQHLLQQQQQHAAYMRHYTHQQQYLQQQQQQQHKNSTNKIEQSSTDTFETLRADYATSKYLTTTHSPNHERQHRPGQDQRSPPQPSPSMGQSLLPPPSAIVPPTSNPSVQSSHHSQQQAALLASQLFASTGVYPQDLIASGLLPYTSYYGSLPASAPFLFDSRFMHEYATAAANNEQLKAEQHKAAAMRLSRQHHHQQHHHSPPDPSYSKRHSHDLGYSTNDYPTSIWRSQNLPNSQQQIHSQMKHNPGTNENPLLKLNELSRHSTTRAPERNSRSPDDYHHRVNQSRTAVESPSIHFQRVEAHNHHKSSHEKSNPNLHFPDHSTDNNSLNYLRQPQTIHKSQTSHHHRHHHQQQHSNRTLIPPIQNSQISPHHSAYLIPNHHHSPVETLSPQRQQSHYSQQQRISSHHNNTKEPISIQEFINKNVNEFVSSANNDNKNSNIDLISHEPLTRTHQVNNSDQPILLDGDDDSNSIAQSDMLNKSNTDSEMPERRRDSSIKKILSNQPLEKQEYVEINQKVQNSTVGASKVHSNNDQTGIERSNSTSGRTKSRGSITMRMLMGASDIYADGKVQSNTTTNEETSNKRSASPDDKCEKLDYLIRDALDRECAPLMKHDETSNVFQNPSKRLRTSPKDDEQQSSSYSQTSESSTNIRDPFALQPHSKGQHHQLISSTNPEKNWQAIIQQQQYHLTNSYSTQFPSRPSSSTTQGNPIHSSASNNQLINPRYSHHINKNEQQSSPPDDHSPKAKISRKVNQMRASPSDIPQESSSSSLKSPPTNPISISPPMIASPTTSVHSLKKRLISEYELEQQRNSPSTEEISKTDREEISNVEETISKPAEETEHST